MSKKEKILVFCMSITVLIMISTIIIFNIRKNYFINENKKVIKIIDKRRNKLKKEIDEYSIIDSENKKYTDEIENINIYIDYIKEQMNE